MHQEASSHSSIPGYTPISPKLQQPGDMVADRNDLQGQDTVSCHVYLLQLKYKMIPETHVSEYLISIDGAFLGGEESLRSKPLVEEAGHWCGDILQLIIQTPSGPNSLTPYYRYDMTSGASAISSTVTNCIPSNGESKSIPLSSSGLLSSNQSQW